MNAEVKYTPASPVITPKAGDFVPHSYVLAQQFTKCTRCDSEYEHYSVSLVRHYKPPFGEIVRQVTPTDDISMPLPVGVATMRPRTIPVCGKCHALLPDAQHGPTATEKGWAEAIARDAERTSGALAKKKAAEARDAQKRVDLVADQQFLDELP